MTLTKAIEELNKAQSDFKYRPETMVADIVLMGLTMEVYESAKVVEILANSDFPHRAFANARNAFEAAQQAMVLAAQEDYALAGARAWVYFYKKDSEWLANARPEGSGVTNKEDAQKWYERHISQMAKTWDSLSPNKGQLLYRADELLRSQKKGADNWLGQSMGVMQDHAYRVVFARFGGNATEDSISMNKAIYGSLSRETHARMRYENIAFRQHQDGFLEVDFGSRDNQLNAKSARRVTLQAVQEAMLALTYRIVGAG